MKKYLREIEMAGVILASTGIVNSLIWGSIYGGWICGIGILLMLIVFLYKAFHWNEYARDNKQYIWIILLTIALLFIQMLEAQEAVDRWIREYGVRYFSELTNMAVLTEEVGELARVIARKYGDQSFKEGEKDNLGEEMADVLWVLLCLANQTGVDLTEELQKSIEKKTERDSLRHIHNKKLLA